MSDRCRCGEALPSVAEEETPFEFCGENCKGKARVERALSRAHLALWEAWERAKGVEWPVGWDGRAEELERIGEAARSCERLLLHVQETADARDAGEEEEEEEYFYCPCERGGPCLECHKRAGLTYRPSKRGEEPNF